MSEFRSIDEIIDFAIKREEEAYNFYKEWAGKVKPEIKPLFEKLAEEEVKHKEKLLEVKSGELRKFVESGSREVLDMKMTDYLVDVEVKPDMSYQDALILAMKREKMAFRFYEDFANKSTDENVKNLFISLAQEEARHKLRIEILYDDYMYPAG